MTQIRMTGRVDRLSLALLLALLALRFPFLMLASGGMDSELAMAIYLDATYLCTAALMAVQRRRLSLSNITAGAVYLFLALPMASLILSGLCDAATGQSLYWSPVQIVISAALAIFLWRKKDARLIHQTPRRLLVWLSLSVLAAVGAALLYNLADTRTAAMPTVAGTLPALCFAQLVTAAVAEEPLFRGFLWGFLRERNCPDHWIWLIQAGLFMLGHLYYITTMPFSFWVLVPTAALLLGLIAWRSRSILFSMVAHGILNGLGEFLSFYV